MHKGTSVSYQVDVLSTNDVLLSSTTQTANPVTTRFPAVSHVHVIHSIALFYYTAVALCTQSGRLYTPKQHQITDYHQNN